MKRFQLIIKGSAILFSLLMVLFLTAGCAGSTGGGDGSGGGGIDLGGGFTPDPSPVFVSAFCPNHSDSDAADDGGYGWVEIKIADIDALSGVDWKLKYSTYNYAETTLLDSTDISWTLANDEVIRVHGSSYAASDTVKTDNNADKWDYTTSATFFISTSYAHIWLEDGDGTHLDTVAYSTSKNTNSYWIEDDNVTNLQDSVDLAIWGGSTIADGVTVNGQYAKLADNSSDGNSKDDWEDVELDDIVMTAESGSPASIYENTATDVTFSVDVALFGNASITGINGDFSNLGEGSSVALTDSDADGVYSVTLTGVDVSAASYDITYTTDGLTLDGAAATEETVNSTFEVQASSIDMTVESSNPVNISENTATDVTFNIKVELNGNASITGVNGDFSTLGEGSSVALADDDSDGVYSVTLTGIDLSAASYDITYTTTGLTLNGVAATEETVDSSLTVLGGSIGTASAQIQKFVCNYSAARTAIAGEFPDGATVVPFIELKINDVASLGSGWTLEFSNGSYNNVIYDGSELNGGTLADGDIIRVYKQDMEADHVLRDTDGTQGTNGRWDFRSESSYYITGTKNNVIYIQKADGTIVDFLHYARSGLSDTLTNSDAITAKSDAVSGGQWPSVDIGDALVIDTDNPYTLTDDSSDGNAASAWGVWTP